MSASHSTTTITLDILIQKLTLFFKDYQKIEDLSKVFSKALRDINKYRNKEVPEDKNSEEFKKAITLFSKPDCEPLPSRYLKDSMSVMDVYNYLKEKNMEIFKNCVVALPDVIQRIKEEMNDMKIDHNSEHQKDYQSVMEFVCKLDDLVSADIRELEANKILIRKGWTPF